MESPPNDTIWITETLVSHSADETFRLGEAFGKEAVGGEVIGLIGGLGTGKTQWVQGLASGLGVDPASVNSPTFVLMQHHPGRIPLCHIDLYRMNSEKEITHLGLDEYIGGLGVTAIEWADKKEGLGKMADLMITLRDREGDQRAVSLSSCHPRIVDWIGRICSLDVFSKGG